MKSVVVVKAVSNIDCTFVRLYFCTICTFVPYNSHTYLPDLSVLVGLLLVVSGQVWNDDDRN